MALRKTEEPMIKAIDLAFSYTKTKILKDIFFDLEDSLVCVVLGPNGSGKTTLLKLLDKLYKPTKGSVLVENEDLEKMPLRKVAKKIAYLAQESSIYFPFSVFDVVLSGRAHNVSLLSQPSEQDIDIANKAISMIGINHLRNEIFDHLSGGQKRLVLIAQALSQGSKILLFDEPTNHLDFSNQYAILHLISKLIKNSKYSAIITLHDPNLAFFFADIVVMLKEGSILAYGPTREVMNAENLSKLYNKQISIINAGDRIFIVPKEINEQIR